MRVLELIAALAPEFGGPVQTCTESAEALAARGHRVRVVTTDRGAGRRLTREEWCHGAGRAEFVFHRALSVSGPEIAPGFVRDVLRARSYDIVEVYGAFNAPATGAMALLRAMRVPYVVRPLGTLTVRSWKKRVALRIVEAANLSGASRVLFSSDLEMQQALETGLEFHGVVVPEGIDTVTPPPPEAPDLVVSGDYLLYLGRLHRQKGFDVLLPAFARVAGRHAGLHLVIAGPDVVGYRGFLEARCRALGIPERVRFVGAVYGSNKLSLLSRSRGLVLPSHSESFGRVVLEAAAAGIPSAVSDRVGVAAAAVSAGAAFSAPLDAYEYSLAVERLLAADREATRDCALGFARRMSWGASAERLEAVLAEVLHARREVRDGG